jgi:hypothetical protein
MPPVKYELGFYIAEDGILHRHRRENLISFSQVNAIDISFKREGSARLEWS